MWNSSMKKKLNSVSSPVLLNDCIFFDHVSFRGELCRPTGDPRYRNLNPHLRKVNQMKNKKIGISSVQACLQTHLCWWNVQQNEFSAMRYLSTLTLPTVPIFSWPTKTLARRDVSAPGHNALSPSALTSYFNVIESMLWWTERLLVIAERLLVEIFILKGVYSLGSTYVIKRFS